MHERIIILDFGSQYTQLIARRIREAGVYSEIHPCTVPPEAVADLEPEGLVLSGGPCSIYDAEAPQLDERFLHMTRADGSPMPVLGICYGLQAMAHLAGGNVAQADRREFGRARIQVVGRDNGHADLFADVPDESTVWMSHGDHLTELPSGYEVIARTENAPVAAVKSHDAPHYGVQFHPEVVHTDFGRQILENFAYEICGCRGDWTPASFVEERVEAIRETVGNRHVILGLSGGVDSSVAAALLDRAIGDQLHCIFVNNGLLRKGEWTQVQNTFRGHFHMDLHAVDATDRFLANLDGVIDPEEKRNIIGNTFMEEVREIGRLLDVPDAIVGRHPFPGPGLAIRILGAVTPERLHLVRESDAIFIDELRANDLYDEVWQAFTVLLPVQSVGVMGDERTYENVCAVRAVTSVDGMTADWAHLPHDFLGHVANRIVNEVRGINRAVYDITSKPPATIEWE